MALAAGHRTDRLESGGGRVGLVSDRPDVKWASPGRCGSCGDLGRCRRYEDLLGRSLIGRQRRVMRLPKLAFPGGRAEAIAISGPAPAKTTDRLRPGTVRWRRPALVAVAVMGLLLAGCGAALGHLRLLDRRSRAPRPVSRRSGSSRRLGGRRFRLPRSAPISLRRFSATVPPAVLNAMLAGAGQLGLVSVASTRPNSVVFVMSVRGAQRFRVEVTVDAHGLIDNIQSQELASRRHRRARSPRLRRGGWLSRSRSRRAGSRSTGRTRIPAARPLARSRLPCCSGASGSIDRTQRQRPGSAGPEHAGGGGQLAVGRRGGQPAL